MVWVCVKAEQVFIYRFQNIDHVTVCGERPVLGSLPGGFSLWMEYLFFWRESLSCLVSPWWRTQNTHQYKAVDCPDHMLLCLKLPGRRLLVKISDRNVFWWVCSVWPRFPTGLTLLQYSILCNSTLTVLPQQNLKDE